MNFDEQFNSYIGVDETGVGDYFTPVVSVACFIPKNNIAEIIDMIFFIIFYSPINLILLFFCKSLT